MAIEPGKVAHVDEAGREVMKVIPLKGVRKIVAKNMRESLDRSPQGTSTVKAEISELVAFREAMKQKGVRLSFSALFARAVALALRKHPILNASRQGEEIIIYNTVNLAVAAFVNERLYVPVLENTDEKDAVQLTRELDDVVEKLRAKDFSTVKMKGSTFTVNNLGNLPFDTGTPFLNPPEAAILLIGRTLREVVVREGDRIDFGWMATLSLTTDHAIIDGTPKARFVGTMLEILARPEQYMLNA